MIKKERTEPLRISKLIVMIRRLLASHHQISLIESDLAKYRAGYRGEQALDYYLEYLPQKDYYILHDLRLFDGMHFFQIDTLVVTSYFILIVEVKNIAGKIVFDPYLHQMIRSIDGREEGFADPFLQVQWHSDKLASWLHLHKFPFIPIDHLVVISNPSTIIETSKYTPIKLTHSANLRFEIEAMKERFTEEVLTKDQLRKLCKLLNKKHTPHNPDVMKHYKITPDELLSGVYCEKCETLTMERKHGRWICTSCSYISKDAHVEALRDYALLIGDTITNRELRKFLNLSSSYVAKTILQSMNLQTMGENKGRKYKLPF